MAEDLLERVAAAQVEPGTVKMWWLLQAGFLFKSPQGAVVLVDPHLSNEVEGLYGTARGEPAPIEASRTTADAILATHWHEDHLDPASILPFARAGGALFVGPPSVGMRVRGRGVDPDRTVALLPGESTTVRDVTITATSARHEVPGYLTEMPSAASSTSAASASCTPATASTTRGCCRCATPACRPRCCASTARPAT